MRELDLISRRELLGSAGAAAGTLCAMSSLVAPAATAAELRPSYYTPWRAAVELEGKHVGFVNRFSGGRARPAPPDRSRLPEVENIELVVGAEMLEPFYRWLGESVSNTPPSQFALVHYDSDKEAHRMELSGVYLTGCKVGAWDVSQKTPLQLIVSASAAEVRYPSTKGTRLPAQRTTKAKARTFSHAQLFVQGLEAATQHTVHVGDVGFTQSFAPTAGDFRNMRSVRSALPVAFSLPTDRAEPFYKWYQEFVTKGGPERAGQLQLLSASSEVMLTAALGGLGLQSVSPPLRNADDAISHTDIVLYCRTVDFDFQQLGA